MNVIRYATRCAALLLVFGGAPATAAPSDVPVPDLGTEPPKPEGQTRDQASRDRPTARKAPPPKDQPAVDK